MNRRRFLKKAVQLLAAAAVLPVVGSAAVRAAGAGLAALGSPERPFRTIQGALGAIPSIL